MKKTALIIITSILFFLLPCAAFATTDNTPTSEATSIEYTLKPTADPNVFDIVKVDPKTRSIISDNHGRLEATWMQSARSLAVSVSLYDDPNAIFLGTIEWYEEGDFVTDHTFEVRTNGATHLFDCPLTYKKNKNCSASVYGLIIGITDFGGMKVNCPFKMY